VLVTVLVVYFFVATQFRWFAVVGNRIFGTQPKPISFYDFTMSVSRSVLRQELNSLPVLLGIAVMIKLIKRWWMKQQETEQVAREKTKAELQLLKAQVHPHFLFNTLNNIYFFTLSGSPKAPEMITKLSGLLHYILNECNQPLVPLEKEIKMIQDYVSLEKIRYGDDMKMTVELPDHGSNHMIAPLLLIPFIENSFKHGASKMLTYPYVRIQITVENNFLHLFITNSRPEIPDAVISKGNIGLKNVKKRLELLYPLAHELNIVEEPGSFSVFLKIRLADSTIANKTDEAIKQVEEYAMA
jgi:LytS/YehU family sensor histidine kinase